MIKRIYGLGVLLIILGLTTIFAVSLETVKHLDQKGFSEVEHVRKDIVLTAKNLIQNDKDLALTKMKLSGLSQDGEAEVNERFEELVLFSESYFETLLVDQDLAFSMLSEMLNEEEILLIEEILSQAFGNYTQVSNGNQLLQGGGGYAKLRLYVHYSSGWFYGQLITTLLTLAITPHVVAIAGLGTAAGGPVGLAVGAIIGATLGVAIERSINYLVYRNGQAGFTFDLINTTIVEGWLIPFTINIEFNLLDILFSIINFSGGKWITGASGAPRPANLPRLAYA